MQEGNLWCGEKKRPTMNFCGGGIEQQVCQDEYSARLPDPPGCGCVQVESLEEDKLETKEEPEGVEFPIGEISLPAIGEKPRVLSRLEKGSFANDLACIDEALQDCGILVKTREREEDNADIPLVSSSGILINSANSSPQIKEDLTRTPISSFRERPVSPSPLYLNPLSTQDWSGAAALFCPTLNNSQSNMETSQTVDSPVEECLSRIEKGFCVRLVSGPPPLYCDGMDEVNLFLRHDRTKLCLQSSQEIDQRDNEALQCGIEISIRDISRLEVGRGNCPRKSFSFVVKKPHDFSFFDLEARSPLEKEVILSTLIVLLDQANNKKSQLNLFPKGTGVEWVAEGTIDQPILCSPSLEQEQKAIPFGWEQGSSYHPPELAGDIFREPPPGELPRIRRFGRSGGRSKSSYESREKRKKIIVLERKLSVDSRYIVPEEKVCDSKNAFSQKHSSSGGGQLERPEVEKNDKGFQDGRVKDRHRDRVVANSFQDNRSCDNFAKSDHDELVLEAAASMQNPKWCSDDVCSLALQNIADSCTGIFAVKQDDGSCTTSSLVAEQQELLEEYIATALGAPNAVYSCIMEGDVWNSEMTSPPETSQKITGNSRRIFNRARVLHAQAARLRTLRNEMTFAAALKQSREKMHFVQTTQSFDDANLKAVSQAADRFHSSALLQHVVDTMMLNDSSGSEPEEIAFYDSDPEDIKPRAIHRHRPRRVEADRLNTNNLGHSEEKGVRTLSSGLGVIPTTKKVKKLDEDAIVDIVQVSSTCVLRCKLYIHAMQNFLLTYLL